MCWYYFVKLLRSVITWSILLWMLPHCQAENDGTFECGTHGRFEYCIDGIPGCIIGCHCHPGYYFDTETKICEPNIKLTLNYRRHYIPEPTRVQNPTILSDDIQTETLPVLTTHNIIDEHVNDITKNADDLGDWLYNQFFKTIETQVINNTNKDSQLTRRSGRGSPSKYNKLKRRARRKGNRHKKKKKGLKGKLLRIAEDDSLFQSSDSSNSDSSSSSSSQSYTSFESDSDEDHGHKKIVLINKKPKPPLPSFIFLPNMNTPFYPPIGLPPPPVMPMYPMVPIPPMMPAPPLAFSGHAPECDENTTTATTGTATISTTSMAPTTEELTAKTDSITSTTAETEPVSTETPTQRSHYKKRKRKKIKSFENIPDEDDEPPFDFLKPNLESRHKILKQLRQRINNPRMNEPPFKRYRKPFDNNMNQLLPPDTLMGNGLTDDGVPINENSPPANVDDMSELDNVDFKYLSQLIHRVKENQTEEVPAHVYDTQDYSKTIIPPEWSKKRYHNFNVPLNSGRRFNQYVNTSRNNQADDSYYSKLGRQIATLIRTIDADKEKVEIEKVQQKINEHPYFNENGPRTFWERSVRSPLKFFHNFKTKFEDLKNSNELLFNIENKVETVASTVPTLSLQEIENMINVMQAARTQFQSNSKMKQVKPSAKTLNVNLWPQDIKQFKKSVKTSSTNPNIFTINGRKSFFCLNNTVHEILNRTLNKIERNNLHPSSDNMYNLNDNLTKRKLPLLPALRNITTMYSEPLLKLKDRRILHTAEKSRHIINPILFNYKNMKKFFFDDSNHYSFQNDNLRLHYSPARRSRFINNKLIL